MAEHIDPADRLRTIGRRDTPALDGDRLAAIEVRVMATVTAPVALEPSDASAGGRDRRATWFAVAAALLVLAVLGAVAFAVRDRSDGLLIQAADGVVIEQPDGAPEVAAVGDELVDGTIVEVGPGGSSTVGGVEYGPGRYVVDGGTLRLDPPEITPIGDDGEVPPAVASTTTSTSTTSTTPSPTTVARSTTTSSTTTSTSVAVRPTEPPVVTRAPAAGPTTTVRPQRTTTTTIVAVPLTRPPTTQPPISRPQATAPSSGTPPTTRPSARRPPATSDTRRP